MRLSEPETRHRVGCARVARLATVTADGRPHLVPVTFALVDDAVVFAVDDKPKRTGDLRRLRNIATNPAVTFLVDVYDEDWSLLWWARADGVAAVVPDADRAPLVQALCEKYPQYTERPPQGVVVRTEVTSWRGWAASYRAGRYQSDQK